MGSLRSAGLFVLGAAACVSFAGCHEPSGAKLAPDAGVAESSAAMFASAARAPAPVFALPDQPYDLLTDLAARTADLRARFGPSVATSVESDVYLFVATDPKVPLPATLDLVRRAIPRYFAGRFERRFDRAVSVLLFASSDAFKAQCKNYLPVDQCARAYGFYWAKTREVLVDLSMGITSATHGIVHPIVQTDAPSAPVWIDEGISSLYEHPSFDGDDGIHGTTNWRLVGLKPALGADPATSQAQLASVFAMSHEAFHGSAELLHYSVARYFCQWLDSQPSGESTTLLWAFYRAWKKDIPDDPYGLKTLTRITGKDVEQLQREWWAWAKSLKLPKG